MDKFKILTNVYRAMQKYDLNLDFISDGQVESKEWLIDRLNESGILEPDELIFVMAGWYGLLPAMMFQALDTDIDKIRSFDIDIKCEEIADLLNADKLPDWEFKAATADITNLKWTHGSCQYNVFKPDGTKEELFEKPSLIINTSCEHIEHYAYWLMSLPKGIRVALQANDLLIPEHVNRVTSIEHFKDMTNLSEVYVAEDKYIPVADYTRFLLIGRT